MVEPTEDMVEAGNDVAYKLGLALNPHYVHNLTMASAVYKAMRKLAPEIPLNENVKYILGQSQSALTELAKLLRVAGHEIEHNEEEERAAVLHWMLNLYLRHGTNWYTEGDKYLKTGRLSYDNESREEICLKP